MTDWSGLLVIDDSRDLADRLSTVGMVNLITDNAGPELLCDLLMASALLERQVTVVFHVKGAPFFVSDALAADVARTIGLLRGAAAPAIRGLGTALADGWRTGRLVVLDHHFWASADLFASIPSALRSVLGRADFTIVKGDANYRRLLADRRWPSDVSLAQAARGFPTPFAVLRTLKSELIADVPRDRAQTLSAQDPDWLTNGVRGVIQVVEPAG